MSDLRNAVIKLMSSPHYKELAAYEPPFNPFEIVGATHRELIHSSVLAWLLRDEANKEFRQKFVAKIATDKPELDLSVKEVKTEYSFEASKAGANFDAFDAGSIDVFAHFESLKLVIGIEVKVNAGEGLEQVKKYQNFLCKEYSSYEKVIVFLTPGGWKPETADENNVDVPVLPMSWDCISEIIREMRPALGNENDFRMQFSQHIERNIIINEIEEQRIVRKLLSEGDNEKTLDQIIDNMPSLIKDIDILREGNNKEIIDKIIKNMPLQGYSAQWKKIVAKVCGVKKGSLKVKPYSEHHIVVRELKICIPEWQNAGLPFTLMLYKYQNAGVRILLHKDDCLEGSEPKAELKEFADRSGGVVNKEFPQLVPDWKVWHSVLVKDGANEEVKGTLIDDIWGEGWEKKAEERLREQIERTGLLQQINEWIKTKGANKG